MTSANRTVRETKLKTLTEREGRKVAVVNVLLMSGQKFDYCVPTTESR